MSTEKSECTGCGDAECSCGLPIWSYRVRTKGNATGDGEWNFGGRNRREAIIAHSCQNPAFEYGPVQRTSDPPYAFVPESPPRVRKISGSEAVAYREPPSPMINEPLLARRLFETDPRVRAFLSRVADHRVVDGPSEAIDGRRMDRAMEVAWERNESNWRSEWEDRAKAVFDLMRKP